MGITAFPFSSVIDVPTARILGRDDAGTGPVEALTNTEIFAILGTGTPSASTYLRGDGTWSTVSAGISSLNGLTNATQTFAVGTTGTDVAFSSAAGVHTLNIPDASVTARGVVTTGTQRFAGIKYFNAADIRLGSGTNDQRISAFSNDLYIDNNVGSNIYFRCSAASVLHLTVSSTSPNVRSLAGFSIATNTVLEAGGNDVLESRRSTNAQTYRVYNTYTSATSFERLNLSWASNICYIGTEKGSAGGTARDLTLGTDGAVRLVLPAATTSGALYLGPRADNTTTGGNARGDGAVDLQISRTAANQVASGQFSVAAGANNRISGTYAAGFGFGHLVSGTAGVAIGNSNRVDATGLATGLYAYSLGNERVHATDSFNSQGGQQIVDTVLRVRTTGTTAGSMIFRVRSGFLQTYLAQISGAKSDGTAVAVYFRKIIVKNVGGTLTLVNAEGIGTDYEDNAATALTVDTSGTNLRFQVTGILGETWTWCTVLYGMDNQW